MKKTIISVCAASLLVSSVIVSTPKPVYATDSATRSYIAHTTLSAVALAVGLWLYLERVGKHILPLPEGAIPVSLVANIAGAVEVLGQSAITQWMDKSGKILAVFTGAEGHVTDKWVGPPEINKTIYTVDDFAGSIPVTDIRANILKTAEAYLEHKPRATTAADLAKAQVEYELAEDQSNVGIQKHRAKKLYTAQNECISAMAEALYMKKMLSTLAAVHHDGEEMMANAYSNTKSTLATLEARRGLYNTLLVLKYMVSMSRARLRAQAMRQDVTPVGSEPQVVGNIGGN